jgi:cytochrome c oxidase assembly protein subunit 20
MVWPFSRGSEGANSDGSTPQPKRSSERVKEEPSAQQQLLLEDTEPRFNNGPANPQLPLKQAVDSIKTDDFKFDSLVKMPCFREAGLTGLSALGVLSTVVFVVQKSPTKAVNWGIGGLLLGSTVSWEQCRSQRRKEMAFAARARETVASKEKPMLKKDETLTEDEEKNRVTVKSWWSRG